MLAPVCMMEVRAESAAATPHGACATRLGEDARWRTGWESRVPPYRGKSNGRLTCVPRTAFIMDTATNSARGRDRDTPSVNRTVVCEGDKP